MKKKNIAILGSTGSIGKTTLNIIKKNKEEFNIFFLSTNKNINTIYKQAKENNVKNIIVISKFHYLKLKKKIKGKKINIYNDYSIFKKFKNKKLDYVMSAITGLDGLEPTYEIIKKTKKIAIANKETIICSWNLIKKRLKKYKTEFVPVDSEHFSIWSILRGFDVKDVEKIILTASGGPFLNTHINKLKKINPIKALKHPNWSMGKKISIDSSLMTNKLFEVIETQRIFNINYKKIEILIHPKSYLHAIVKFKNGVTKLLVHDTNMIIPIFNSIYSNGNHIKTKNIDIDKLNNLKLKKPDFKKFPSLKILSKIPNSISLYETVLVSANDEIVEQFLNGKIKYLEINKILSDILIKREFTKLKKQKPANIKQIMKLNRYVRLKTNNLCIK